MNKQTEPYQIDCSMMTLFTMADPDDKELDDENGHDFDLDDLEEPADIKPLDFN
jgi:hypothetical protein